MQIGELPSGRWVFDPQPSDGTLKYWWSELFALLLSDSANQPTGEAQYALLYMRGVGSFHFVRRVGAHWYQDLAGASTESSTVMAATWMTWVAAHNDKIDKPPKPPTEGVTA